jgi:glycosyltransferase involved in cell wall biosynthesis
MPSAAEEREASSGAPLRRRRVLRTTAKRLPEALRLGDVEPAARSLRILLVSQYFPPEIGATQSRMQAFAEYLAARGHQVTVICEFPNHPHGVVPREYAGHVYEDDRSNSYRVLRVWVKASTEKTQRTRMQFYLSYMALATAIAPVAGRADVVVATSPPLFTGAAGLALARLNRAACVLDVRDLWPEAAVSLNQISGGWPLRAAEWLERTLYRGATVVTAVTRPFCDHIDAVRAGGPATVFLPNGTLEHFFEAAPGPRDRERLGVPPGRFAVTFAGTFGIAQALPKVLDAAALSDERLHFAFIGDGPMRSTIAREAGRLGLKNVTFLPQLPVEEIASLLAASDALLVPLSEHPTFLEFVPSKLIDFMAVGRPVLVSAAGESARLVRRAGAGLAVPPENPAALVQAASRLADHPDEADSMGAAGRAFARSRMRLTQAERLEQLLLDVTR